MFIDELKIKAMAGNGGNGVVRWRRMKFKPKGGPAGGNGGRGGDVYIRGVRDLSILSQYRGVTEFRAANGADGSGDSMHGEQGADYCIDVPVGAQVTDCERDRTYTLATEGATQKILNGGAGGLGNEYFKSSTNRTPQQSTRGKQGESGMFRIELSLLVDIGLIGTPNAGKSTLLNTLTHARSKIGAYPFTTTEPHLGDFYGHTLADIPGLITGAAEGKGLGHRFLRHIQKTNMLLHCVALDVPDVLKTYHEVRTELSKFDATLARRREWIIGTKADLVSADVLKKVTEQLEATGQPVYIVSATTGIGIEELRSALSAALSVNLPT